MGKTRFSDLAVGIGFIILGISTFIYSGTLPTAKFGIGSGGYPMVISIILVILGVVQAGTVLSRGLPAPSFDFNKRALLFSSIAAISSLTYVLLLSYFGFLLLTPFFLFGMTMFFGYRKYITAAIVSVSVSTLIYLLFTKAFMIFLPELSLF